MEESEEIEKLKRAKTILLNDEFVKDWPFKSQYANGLYTFDRKVGHIYILINKKTNQYLGVEKKHLKNYEILMSDTLNKLNDCIGIFD